MAKIYGLMLFVCLISASARAQTNSPGSWAIITLQSPASMERRWGGFLEGQLQTDKIPYKQLYYTEFKGGLSYMFHEDYTILLGGGRYTFYDQNDLAKGPTSIENRFWEQLSYKHHLGPLNFEHRYRLEQRWIDHVFRTRVRYKLNAILPINKTIGEAGGIYLSAWDEIFLGNQQYSWERNRIAAVAGYHFSPLVTIQAGFMNEDNNSVQTGWEKNNLFLNLIFNLWRRDGSNGSGSTEGNSKF